MRDDPRTIRYGATENLYGYDAIKAFRAARSPIGLARTLSKTVITAYGRDYAVASTLFHRDTVAAKSGVRPGRGFDVEMAGAWSWATSA